MLSAAQQLIHVQNTNQALGPFPFIFWMRVSNIQVFFFGKKVGKWRETVPNMYTTETFSSVTYFQQMLELKPGSFKHEYAFSYSMFNFFN